MVVGNGPSGTDIAVAAGQVAAGGFCYLAIRTGVDLRPRYPYGLPRHAWMMLGSALPEKYCVWLQKKTGAVKYNAGDFGVWEAPPRTGAGTGYRGPELLSALRAGASACRRHIPSALTRLALRSPTGRILKLDSVIMATGFLPVSASVSRYRHAVQHRDVLSRDGL